jgi:hypothetical protein
MSRKNRQAAYHPGSKSVSVSERFVQRLLGLPRLGRIAIIALFAIAITLALNPIIDTVYLNYLYTPETVIAPALVAVAFGLAMYLVGWQLMVGTVGETPPARLVVLWYVGIGALAILLIVVWLITGVSSGNAPTF